MYVVALFALPVSTGAKAATLEPYQYVLALQRLQDQVVQGDVMAHKAQREMLLFMANDFKKVRVVDWQKKKNAEALLIYVLSGGNPELAEKLLEIKNQPALPDNLLAGAFAYVTGNYSEAKKLLSKSKLQGMSINVRSQVAIAQATLYAESDYKTALKYLAQVRLWKPGTLLEEAALRRSFSLAGAHGQKQKFLLWSSQYVRRFRHSFYLPDFISKFSFYVTKLNLAGDHDFANSVIDVIRHLKENQQASIYLTVARAAVLDGNNIQAKLMATKARTLLKKGTSYAARAELYFTASQVAKTAPEKIEKFLSKVERGLLTGQDQKIYDVVKMMLTEVRKKPQLSTVELDKNSQKSQLLKLSKKQIEEVSPIVSRARKLIDNANNLLEAGG